MDDLSLWPLPAGLLEPGPDYCEKIHAEMELVKQILLKLFVQQKNEKIWCKVGDIEFGLYKTPFVLRYRVLTYHLYNPPDPRGERMYCRPSPYTIYVRREDLAEILPYGIRTIDRMLAEVRKALDVKPYSKIKVEVFCMLCNLPEDKIQEQLYELHKSRWENPKHKK